MNRAIASRIATVGTDHPVMQIHKEFTEKYKVSEFGITCNERDVLYLKHRTVFNDMFIITNTKANYSAFGAKMHE